LFSLPYKRMKENCSTLCFQKGTGIIDWLSPKYLPLQQESY
jgi:hypothetical protein